MVLFPRCCRDAALFRSLWQIHRDGIASIERAAMHELSLCESITELVAEYAQREGVAHVSRVVIALGVAAAVDAEALQFCFPITAADTVAAGAELVINSIALKARCEACRADYAPETLIAPCPACGSHAREILEGRDMRVVSFDCA
jgi:hydrogenase nickel incorporation protein HypA/HybF